MNYLSPLSSSMLEKDPRFGIISNPNKWQPETGIVEGRWWACDNGAYTEFDENKFRAHLETLIPYKDKCLFVVAPDVVGDARSTIELYNIWHDIIKKNYKFPVAFVAQDGQENYKIPSVCDWVFIGGTTEWKLGEGAVKVIYNAHQMGKPVHVGRINSWKRYKKFRELGAKTCDGTHPTYEPDEAYKRITNWMDRPISYDLFAGYYLGKSINSLLWS